VHLAGTLLALNKVMPEQARDFGPGRGPHRDQGTWERRLAQRTRAAITGAPEQVSQDQQAAPARPRWTGNRTIRRRNLKNYLPEHRTIVPERLTGYAAQAGRRWPGT